MGIVDHATAVYLKALMEGGRIGPDKRAAYRLPTKLEDFADAAAGAQFIRDHLRGLGDNRSKKKAVTIPEIIAIQLMVGESGLVLKSSLPPFNLNAEDKKIKFAKMGADTNSPRKGTFDPVFCVSGEWIKFRGWGVGQETVGTRAKDFGHRLVRGLPVLPAGTTELNHPAEFVSAEASVISVIRKRPLAVFRKRSKTRDCTFANAPDGAYYNCHRCLKRFTDTGMDGTGENGFGGVFVPRSNGKTGTTAGATAHWLDLERVTPWASDNGALPPLDSLAADREWQRLVGRIPGRGSEAVIEVLSNANGKLGPRITTVAKRHGLDPAQLATDVQAYMNERRDLPCSWLNTRIRYAGAGPQAWQSMINMVRALATLTRMKEAAIEHIEAAAKLRDGEAGIP